jgi:tetratricopeptide (TPR) repeat protein
MHARITSAVFAAALILVLATGEAPLPGSDPRSAGDAAFAAADFGGAETAYRAALTSDPRDLGAALGLARIALYRNDLDDAERYADAAIEVDESNRTATTYRRSIAERRDDGPDLRARIDLPEVDVPFERVDPLPELDIRVDGKDAHVLLDTGADGLDLSSSFAAALGIETSDAGRGTFAGGSQHAIRAARVNEIELGRASLTSVPIHVLDAFPPGIDGVLGTKILYRFLATIDYPNARLVLRPKSASGAFEAAAALRGAVRLPMLLVPDHFIFARARVDGAPEAYFNVDTGGGIGVQATRAELEAASIVPDAARPSTFDGPGGSTRTLPFRTNVTLGTATFQNVPGVYFPDGDQYGIFAFAVGGTLSHELFKRGALTFDFRAMELVFEPTH